MKRLCSFVSGLLVLMMISNVSYADSLVVYFSRAGENYGVGFVEKGSTKIVAEMIAKKKGATLLQLHTVKTYPEQYKACTELVKAEKNAKERPVLKPITEDLSKYNVIYLGYPIWWGDLPMAVYTFLEQHNFKGKTIYPFTTHGGSGISSTVDSIRQTTGATVKEGLAILGVTVQTDRALTQKIVDLWLQKH